MSSSKNLIDRVVAILTKPKAEWPIIAAEPDSVGSLFTKYIIILAAIPSIMGFVKTVVIGVGIPFSGTFRVGFAAGLTALILRYALSLVGVFLMSLIIDALAPSFGGEKNKVQALKTVAYAYTASWIASIGMIVPGIYLLILLFGAGYSIYLLYLGLPNTMKCPPDKSAGYTAVSIIIAIVLSWVVGFLVSSTVGFGAMTGGTAFERHDRGAGPDSVTFDKDSPLGKLAEMGKRTEAARAQLDAAQKSGDSKAQATAAGAMIGAALGGDSKVEALAPDRLKAFLPDAIGGLKRTDLASERNGALGMQTSNAKANYSDNAGHSVELEVTDLGGAKAVLGLAGWAGVESDHETDHGYDKMYQSGDRIIHEQWDRQSNRGEYSEVIAQRFVVKLSGSASGIDDLKAGVHGVDLSQLAALKDDGVTKN